jgi:hypothetical protein
MGRLNQARSNLKQYPILRKYSNNFSFIPAIPYRKIRNIFFWLASDRFDRSIALLSNFEDCLEQLNVNAWSKTKRNQLKAKITANREEANWGILTEVQVTAYLMEKFGKTRVKYAPTLPNRKECDASALVNRRNVFFEVTAVDVGLVEHILMEIFDRAGSAIYQKMQANTYLKLEIDTSRLAKTGQDFDVQKCIQQLADSYDELKIGSFQAVEGTLVVDLNDLRRLWEKDVKLADQIDNVQQLEPELVSSLQRGELSDFSQLTPRAFDNTPIASIWKINTRSSFKAVEISGQGVYPSTASLNEQSSFFKRLCRAVKSKVTKGQLRTGEPNILAVRASNWTSTGYERTGLFESDIAELEFEGIRPHLERCLNDLKPKDLSAIMLFENSFANAQVIFNKHANGSSVLTSGEVNLLISPQAVSLSPFLEFATETLDQARIDRCLQALVETYNGMSVVREFCNVQPFSKEAHAHLSFIQVPIRTRVPKSWFIDPTVISDHIFADFGSAIAEGETRFIVRQIEHSAKAKTVSAYNLEEITLAVNEFHRNGGNTTVILLPLDVFVCAHSWLRTDQTPVLRSWNGKFKMAIDLPSSTIEIPVYFLRKETEISGVIIYDKRQGTIIYKKPTDSKFLNAQLSTSAEDKTQLELLTKSVLSYDVKNKALAIVLRR